MNPWVLSSQGFDPGSAGLREALCTLGNGRFATMGATSDGRARTPGTYHAGCYDRLASEVAGRTVVNEDLVNLPDWLPLTFTTPGSPRNWPTCSATRRSSTCGTGCCAGGTSGAASPGCGNAGWSPWPIPPCVPLSGGGEHLLRRITRP